MGTPKNLTPEGRIFQLELEVKALQAKNAEHIGAMDMWEKRVIELEKEKKELKQECIELGEDFQKHVDKHNAEFRKCLKDIPAQDNYYDNITALIAGNESLRKERDEARDAASEPIMQLTHCAERVEKLQGELKNKSIEIKALYDVIHLLAQEYRPTTVALDGLNLANRFQEDIDAGKNGTGAAECQAAQGTEGTGTEA